MPSRLYAIARLFLGALLVALAVGPRQLSTPARAIGLNMAAKDTLVVAYPGATDTLDPAAAYSNADAAVLRGMYESLVRMKGTSTTQIEGVLATSWAADAAKKVWTFHLRHGVLFHDGTPFTAAAVKFSITRSISVNQGPAYIYGQFLDPSGITVLDPYTVQFHLRVPTPRLLYAMASQWGNWIVSPTAIAAHVVKNDMAAAWLGAHDAGTGPYTLGQFTPGSAITMVKFPGYWRGWTGHHVSRVIISFVSGDATRREMIEHGDADIGNLFTPEDLRAMQKNPNLAVDAGSIVANWTLTPTVAGPFASTQARLALAYAFDYNGFIDGLLKGFSRPARGPLDHTVDGWDPTVPVFHTDLAKARSLFAAAGIKPGTKMTIWYTSEDITTKDVALIAQGQLVQLGFDATITGRDASSFGSAWFGNEPASQRPNLWVSGWSGDYNDAAAWLVPLYHSKNGGANGGGNMGLYHDAQADTLIDQVVTATDQTTRHALIARVERILTVTDPAAVYVAEEANSTAYRSSLHGYYYNPVDVLSYDYYSMWK